MRASVGALAHGETHESAVSAQVAVSAAAGTADLLAGDVTALAPAGLAEAGAIVVEGLLLDGNPVDAEALLQDQQIKQL